MFKVLWIFMLLLKSQSFFIHIPSTVMEGRHHQDQKDGYDLFMDSSNEQS